MAQRARRRISRTSACAGARSTRRTSPGSASTRSFPARAGDVVRALPRAPRDPGVSLPHADLSTLVLTIVDTTLALAVVRLGATQGRAARARRALRRCRASTSAGCSSTASFAPRRDRLVVALIAFGVWVRTGWRDLKARVAQAFTVLRTPTRYLRSVVVWQACDWALRLATIWFFLGAFNIHQSIAQRPARPGDVEPRDARADQPGRHRHRAGAPALHPARPGNRARRCWPSASA